MVNCGILDDWERYDPPAEISRIYVFPLSSFTLTRAPMVKTHGALSSTVKLRAPGGGTDSKTCIAASLFATRRSGQRSLFTSASATPLASPAAIIPLRSARIASKKPSPSPFKSAPVPPSIRPVSTCGAKEFCAKKTSRFPSPSKSLTAIPKTGAT